MHLTEVKQETARLQLNFEATTESIFEAPITRDELISVLRSLPRNKSPGRDGIHSEFLFHLGPRALETVLIFFNLIWNTGIVPAEWRTSIIIPIHKKDKDPADLCSYRPISLTSITGKAMEKIIVKRLNYYLEISGLLAEEQAGFRNSRSTDQHVTLLSQYVKDALDNRQVMTAVFIDLKSAYDNVWREYLLLKLSKLGIRANLFNWIQGFLCQRSCSVRYGNALSKSKILKTGLPQGAVSSCVLFNIYINDLILKIREIPGVKCLLYADDLVIWTISKKENAVKKLEAKLSTTLNALEAWCDTNNMEVNLNKSYCLSFSLMHQSLDLNLLYKGSRIPLCEDFKYLGVIFDRKLTWRPQVEDISKRTTLRLSALKRLAGARWGCTGQTLLQTYRMFILPLLTYCCEPLIVARQNILGALEKIQNQALRIVAGAVKSTPIDAMLMLTNVMPVRTVIQERALILWEKITRVPGSFSLWNEVNQDLTRNLKTQMGFLQGVLQLKNSLGLSFEPELVVHPQDPVRRNLFCINLDLGQKITKSNTDTTILKNLALEMLNISYPEPEWLRIFTDGSLLPDCPNVGAGIYSDIFSFYVPVGQGIAFDGEIAAIRLALSQLQCHLERFSKVVILCDSRAALLAIASDNNPLTQDILDCRHHLENLALLEKTIVLQWVPAHCGVPGNEKADYLAKKGALIMLKISRPMPFYTIKNIIKTSIRARSREDLYNRVSNKPWKKAIQNLCNGPRHRAVAEFRLASGHDCLRNHLYRLKIVPSPICTLCSSGEVMDSVHLPRCPALRKTSLAERYWEARGMLD